MTRLFAMLLLLAVVAGLIGAVFWLLSWLISLDNPYWVLLLYPILDLGGAVGRLVATWIVDRYEVFP